MNDKDQKEAADQPEDDEDAALFRSVMSDAKPLPRTEKAPDPPRPAAKARFTRRDEREVLQESMNSDRDLAEIQSGEALRFQRSSVGRRTFRKLARGGFSVQDELDLHGMTSAEARLALREFLEASCRRGLGCVRIVHGKGLGSGHRGPVLKQKTDLWLRQWDNVLAFVSARQVDGGTGAVYVLLKN